MRKTIDATVYYRDVFEFIIYFGKNFENKTNVEVYEKYLEFCKEKGFESIDSKIAFSRYIVKLQSGQ